jgi:hypothetical protein
MLLEKPNINLNMQSNYNSKCNHAVSCGPGNCGEAPGGPAPGPCGRVPGEMENLQRTMIMKEVVAQDIRGQWLKGHIVSVRGEGSSMEVKIHFFDTEPHLDEWIVYKSRRIQEVIDLLDGEDSSNTVVPQHAKEEPARSVIHAINR